MNQETHAREHAKKGKTEGMSGNSPGKACLRCLIQQTSDLAIFAASRISAKVALNSP